MKSTSLADASPIGAIPPTIATLSILPFLTSDDWLIFRLTSLDCYNLVHGTTNISSSYCPKCQWKSGVKVSRNLDEIHKILAPKDDKEGDDIDSEALWRLALIRDYQFDPEDNETAKKFDTTPVRLMSISFHSPAMTPRSRKAMVDENEDIFYAPTAFSSWKHYRKIDCRLFHATHFPSLKDVPSSARIVGPYFLRSALIFQKIRKSQGSECETNMSNGYLFDLRRLMKDSNYKVSALRAVYSFHSGQRNMNPGFFGGFSTLKKVVDMNWGYPFYTKSQFQVSGDSMGSNRTVYVDLKSGQVILGRKILNGSEASYEPVVNATPIMKDDGIEMHSPEDSFLRWMEEYSDRLANGFYSHGSLYASHDQIPTDRRTGSTLDIFRIIQFPSAKNTYLCSRSITRGVEVLASALFVPGAKSEYTTKDTNIYSIRIRIVTPEDGDEYESVRERGFETCQLVSWNLTMTPKCNSSDAYYDSEPVNYSGEGFFGHFPLLREGGYKKYFQYDSAEDVAKSSSLARDIGKGYYTFRNEVDACEAVMDGYLEFVPGSLHKPQGEIFHVVVAPFPLSNDTQGYFF